MLKGDQKYQFEMLITSITLSSIHPETILEKPSSSDMIVSNRGDFSKMVSEWIFCSPNFAEKVIAFENLIFFIEIDEILTFSAKYWGTSESSTV